MFRTHENFLKSSKRCRESLEQHYKNIDWQLRRIYRARNGIVHRGSTWLPSVTLSEHLRRYLYATVSNIVQDCPNGSGVTLSLVLRKRRLLWNTYMDRLNKADEPFATERSAIDIAAEVN